MKTSWARSSRVVGRSGEAVADVIDTPVVGLDDFFPGGGVARNTAADQHRNYLDIFQTELPGKLDLAKTLTLQTLTFSLGW